MEYGCTEGNWVVIFHCGFKVYISIKVSSKHVLWSVLPFPFLYLPCNIVCTHDQSWTHILLTLTVFWGKSQNSICMNQKVYSLYQTQVQTMNNVQVLLSVYTDPLIIYKRWKVISCLRMPLQNASKGTESLLHCTDHNHGCLHCTDHNHGCLHCTNHNHGCLHCTDHNHGQSSLDWPQPWPVFTVLTTTMANLHCTDHNHGQSSLYWPQPWQVFTVLTTTMANLHCTDHNHGQSSLYWPQPWPVFTGLITVMASLHCTDHNHGQSSLDWPQSWLIILSFLGDLL